MVQQHVVCRECVTWGAVHIFLFCINCSSSKKHKNIVESRTVAVGRGGLHRATPGHTAYWGAGCIVVITQKSSWGRQKIRTIALSWTESADVELLRPHCFQRYKLYIIYSHVETHYNGCWILMVYQCFGYLWVKWCGPTKLKLGTFCSRILWSLRIKIIFCTFKFLNY